MATDILKAKIGGFTQVNPQIIPLFMVANLDFFCKTEQTVEEAIEEQKLDKTAFLERINEAMDNVPPSYNVKINDWPLDLLADYIQKTHHVYTEQTLVKIRDAVGLYLEGEKENKSKIEAFNTHFIGLSKSLGAHMKKEELMLFPAIRKLVAAKEGAIPKEQSVNRFVDNMIHEHTEQFDFLTSIRKELANYKTTNKNNDYTSINLLMKELDDDLSLHLHLENNILFPKAVGLAKKLN